jgi:hypothetical protein
MATDLFRLEASTRQLRDLHCPGNALLFVEAWDADTARRVEAPKEHPCIPMS